MTAIADPFDVVVQGPTLRLVAHGPLVASAVAAQRAALREHLKRAGQAVVLDLAASELVDSMGITLIVGLFKSCQERKLAFSVAGAHAEVLRLFRFFRLNEIFDIGEQ
jgi:anti-anti-sigma factor